MKTRAFIVSVVVILALSMALITLWQTYFNREDYSAPIVITCVSVISLALAYSAFNGRNEFSNEERNEQPDRWQISNRGGKLRRMYPISWKRGTHINMFEFINDNRASLRRARWKEKRLLMVTKPLQKAHSRDCPRCGGSAGRACPCKYRSKY